MNTQTKNEIRTILSNIAEGILAGILISLGGAVFLACYLPEIPYARFIGSFLFPLALICICMRGYALYTGKIGLILENHKKADISLLLLCLLGNLLGTMICGYLIGWILPNLKATAVVLCTGKLQQGEGGMLYLVGGLRAVFCGLLVYLSVDIWRNHKTVVGIVFCIPAFILSGFEHSIADMFYFACSGIATWQAFGYLMMIILGNSVGALVIPLLRAIRPKPEKKEE